MKKKLLFFFPLFFCCLNGTIAKGQEADIVESNLTKADWEALNDFITQRTVLRRLEGIGGKLVISGEIATQWTNRHEKFENKITVDNEEVTQWSVNVFPTVFTLRLRYDGAKTWLSSQLQWKKSGGVPVSAVGIINRAFMGYSLRKTPKVNFYVEGGVSSLGLLFESAVQFAENFAGAHFFYSRTLGKRKGLAILHGGPFIVNIKTKQYAWVAEAIVNQLPGGLLFKYSMIDWHSFRGQPQLTPGTLSEISKEKDPEKRQQLLNSKKQQAQAEHDQKYKFLVCQGLIGCEREFYKIPTYIYAVGLVNAQAEKSYTTLNKRANTGWYVGGTFGVLRKAHDWSFTVRYEYVGALSIPEDDCSGIGHGTLINAKLYQAIIKKDLPGSANGFTNYKGFYFLAMYSLTNSVSLRLNVTHSNPVEKKLGNPFRYNTFGISVVSAF